MNINDVLIGSPLALLLLAFAWIVRPFVSNRSAQVYFLPALLAKMIGAVLLGILYYYYYGGGDTVSYFTHGATHIYDAFWDSPAVGLKLIFGNTDYTGGVYKYASHIWMYDDTSSYNVVRIAGFISLFVGGSYVGTSLFFAVLSFSGLWAMYMAFTKLFPRRERVLALAILFIPSAVFWGSGILKDTITFGFIGWAMAAFIHLIYWRKKWGFWVIILGVSLYAIYSIKLYVVMSLLPAMIVWAYFVNIRRVHNKMLRFMIAPFVIVIAATLSGVAVYTVGETNNKYSVDNIAKTARITAYDVGRWTGKNAGSRYDLGDLDGTFTGMLKLGPAAVNVALFRPYLWEVKNPLMLLASLEGLAIMVLTMIVIVRRWKDMPTVISNPAIIFSLIFALTFAFAVGISTYNFGTLFRYKVPLMPFYGIFLAVAWSKSKVFKRKRKFILDANPANS